MIMWKNRRTILVLPQNEQNSLNHENSETPQGLSDLASMEPFSSFTNQSAILRADTDNVQSQMDLSHMQPHDHAEEQEDDFSPPQNEQNSLKHENTEIPQRNVRIISADVHTTPHHIDVQHAASSSSSCDEGSIQKDDTLMEQNVADNTVVKKHHACDSGAGAEAGGAVVGAEASTTPPPPPLPSAGERSKTDVEQGKLQAKSSSPLKERLTTFFTLLAKAKQVTKRLYRSPNKNHSKSKEGDESHSEASLKKNKTPKNKKNKKPDEEEDEMCRMKKGKSSDDDHEVTFKLRQLQSNTLKKCA